LLIITISSGRVIQLVLQLFKPSGGLMSRLGKVSPAALQRLSQNRIADNLAYPIGKIAALRPRVERKSVLIHAPKPLGQFLNRAKDLAVMAKKTLLAAGQASQVMPGVAMSL